MSVFSWLVLQVLNLLHDLLASSGRRESLPEHLSIEEELLVKRYYEGKIQEVCAALRLPNKIQVGLLVCTNISDLVVVPRIEDFLDIIFRFSIQHGLDANFTTYLTSTLYLQMP